MPPTREYPAGGVTVGAEEVAGTGAVTAASAAIIRVIVASIAANLAWSVPPEGGGTHGGASVVVVVGAEFTIGGGGDARERADEGAECDVLGSAGGGGDGGGIDGAKREVRALCMPSVGGRVKRKGSDEGAPKEKEGNW